MHHSLAADAVPHTQRTHNTRTHAHTTHTYARVQTDRRKHAHCMPRGCRSQPKGKTNAKKKRRHIAIISFERQSKFNRNSHASRTGPHRTSPNLPLFRMHLTPLALHIGSIGSIGSIRLIGSIGTCTRRCCCPTRRGPRRQRAPTIIRDWLAITG